MKTKPLTLQEVTDKFSLWRQHKKARRERIPDELKADVAKLIPFYRRSHIMAALHIHHDFMKSIEGPGKKQSTRHHQKSSRLHKKATTPSIHFIPLELNKDNTTSPDVLPEPNTTTSSCSTLKAVNLEIIRPDGIRLIIPTFDPTNTIKVFLCSY